jgi:DNA helicase HerA-like ATPase
VNTASQISPTGAPSAAEPIGRVSSISGGQAKITLAPSAGVRAIDQHATVGRFLGIKSGAALIIAMISAVDQEQGPSGVMDGRSVARVELIGEIRTTAGVPRFQRGIEGYPKIGEGAVLITERELRIVYGTVDADRALVGELQQSSGIGVHVNIDDLVSRHFAVLGTTGVGKSSGVAILLQKVLSVRPNLRIFLIDPHNEYGQCFGEKAQVLTPRNLRLPFWLFSFEEIVDVIFAGRPGLEEEVEILSEVIPLAKGAYLQYRGADRNLAKKRDPGSAGFTADTPVPYRIEDLVDLLDQRMGKLENRSSRAVHHKLLSRIQTVRNHPRYTFMFENANLGGDTMADILAQLFRLPPAGKPMTIMQLAGFPAEVIDSVVSVLCRMAFDFGLWSDGVAPLLFVCEEAHRYAPADSKLGFGPTRRALSRIAKEGRKYGVYLGLVSQRPCEIDPTIMSQCSTLFVMRLSNERDHAFIRSAVSDAAQNLLSFIPSLGTREVFAFGSGIALPTRMRFNELPATMRPNSEAGTTRSEAAATVQQDLIKTVIDRWRSATMNFKAVQDIDFADTAPAAPSPLSPPAQSAPAQSAPAYASPQAPSASIPGSRPSVLRRPLDAGSPPVATAPGAFRTR